MSVRARFILNLKYTEFIATTVFARISFVQEKLDRLFQKWNLEGQNAIFAVFFVVAYLLACFARNRETQIDLN